MLVENVYGSFKLTKESANKLAAWIEANGIVNPVETDDLHITTTYSKEEPDSEITPSELKNIKLDHKDFSIAVYGRALVIEVDSNELGKIHKDAIDKGASWDYPSYSPHITISYDAAANENGIPLLFPPNFDIYLSHEVIGPIDVSEDAPSNSTSNIAIYSKPIGLVKRSKDPVTFKTFKQKLKTK